MKLACLCPTYGKPKLLQNALACFLAQDYPAKFCKMFVLDDAEQIAPQIGRNWELWSMPKYPTLPSKYRFLVDRADEWGADAYVVWDDDDIYLPWHLQAHADILPIAGWSHPIKCWSLYTGKLELEPAVGRFHGSMAIRKDFARQVGYWGDSPRCNYDQQIMSKLRAIEDFGQSDLWHSPSYVYRWGSTQADHCSGRCKGPNDKTWYTETTISQPGHVDAIVPKFDDETFAVLQELAQPAGKQGGG